MTVDGLTGRRLRSASTGTVFTVADADGDFLRVTTAANPRGVWRHWRYVVNNADLIELFEGGA